ncbi:MAG: thiol:disulfide interchange protein TlpA [Alphaproteobacteria bacterium]
MNALLQKVIDNRRGAALLGLAALAGIAGGAVAVYVNSRDSGNGTEQAARECSAALTLASQLEPQGDLAAFRAAESPDSLTDLAFKAADDRQTGIDAFAGKVVLLNLWATWCGPCRAEMPSLDRLQAEMGGDSFEVVAVNIDTADPERALDFLEEIGVGNLAFYADRTTKIFNDLKRRGLALGLPVTLLIDAQGCTIGGVQGPAEWDSPDAKALIQAALDARVSTTLSPSRSRS